MAKKVKKKYRDLDHDLYDEYDDLYGDDFDLKSLARDVHSTTDWDDYFASAKKMTARRKIEQRRDMKRLYSELDDFEEFGEHVNY
jgi:hypothetical protein